jgi:hypothetical protein
MSIREIRVLKICVSFVKICGLNTALFRRPDDFVELRLKTHGQSIGDYFSRQIAARNRSLANWNFFQDFALLFRRERMNP